VTLRLALTTAALALCLLLLSASPALADYSDHGEPQTSLVASTHPQTYTPSGGLARTGTQLDTWALVAVLVVAGGAALLLASRKRTGART
jgi:LPXTG-motif cell wall-anchored protein